RGRHRSAGQGWRLAALPGRAPGVRGAVLQRSRLPARSVRRRSRLLAAVQSLSRPGQPPRSRHGRRGLYPSPAAPGHHRPMTKPFLGGNVYLWSRAAQNRFLTRCLGPAIRELQDQGLASGFWFDRFDARGPHVFFLLRPIGEPMTVRELLAHRLGPFWPPGRARRRSLSRRSKAGTFRFSARLSAQRTSSRDRSGGLLPPLRARVRRLPLPARGAPGEPTGILASPGGSLVLDPPADRGEPGVDACRDRYPLGGRSRWSPAGGRSRGSILAVPRRDATSGGWRIRRDCDQRAESGDVFAPLERG